MLILSKESVKSKWVQYEVNKALNREVNQSREILFPIRIDNSVFESTEGWAKDLREERHIGNFTQWESSYQSYEEHFTTLLKQLTNTDQEKKKQPTSIDHQTHTPHDQDAAPLFTDLVDESDEEEE